MKKNVIALAVAAAMVAPAAMAEVSITGVLQGELQNLSGDGVVEGMYADHGGNGKIEFKSTEDLGDGMKSIAKFGISTTVSGSPITPRDAYIGLSGNFGTVLGGKLTGPYKGSTVSWDPFLETSAQARGGNSIGMSAHHNGYSSNALAYMNKFGMAKVAAAIIVDEASDGAADPATTGNHGVALSVNAPVGPVEVAFAYQDLSDFGTTGTVDNSAMKLGVKYTAGAIGVAFQYEALDIGVDINHMYLNGTYAAGANTFAAAYGQRDNDGNSTDTYMSLGVIHSFSSKTSAYVAYAAESIETPAADMSAIAAGLRVAF
ncbi:MAG: porin [Chromatiales bacterium]|nr:porin [Chromatiales bacterium]